MIEILLLLYYIEKYSLDLCQIVVIDIANVGHILANGMWDLSQVSHQIIS